MPLIIPTYELIDDKQNDFNYYNTNNNNSYNHVNVLPSHPHQITNHDVNHNYFGSSRFPTDLFLLICQFIPPSSIITRIQPLNQYVYRSKLALHDRVWKELVKMKT